MANILDYIYTGSVLLHSTSLADFISVATLLKLRIEPESALEPKIPIPPEPNGSIKYPDYNYDKYPSGYDISRFPKPNFEYKNSLCGPECYESLPGFKNKKEQICDYKTQDKALKFSPIILQDERNPNLTNGSRLPENKMSLNYIRPKEINQVFTNLDSPIDSNNLAPYPKEYPTNYVSPEQNGLRNDTQPVLNKVIANSAPNVVQNGVFVNPGLPAQQELKEPIVPKKKTTRKVPNLMPISRFTAFKAKKGLYNRVFPSPWSPRINPVVADPRNEYITRDKLPLNVVSF